MQIILHIRIIPQSPIMFRNRRLIDQEIRPHRINGHRILRNKHAGRIIPVKRCLPPSGSFFRNGRTLRCGADQRIQHIQHRLPAKLPIRHQIRKRAVAAHLIPRQKLMQVCPFRRTHGVSIDKRAKMILSTERDTIAMPLQVRQIDQIFLAHRIHENTPFHAKSTSHS